MKLRKPGSPKQSLPTHREHFMISTLHISYYCIRAAAMHSTYDYSMQTSDKPIWFPKKPTQLQIDITWDRKIESGAAEELVEQWRGCAFLITVLLVIYFFISCQIDILIFRSHCLLADRFLILIMWEVHYVLYHKPLHRQCFLSSLQCGRVPGFATVHDNDHIRGEGKHDLVLLNGWDLMSWFTSYVYKNKSSMFSTIILIVCLHWFAVTHVELSMFLH